MTQNNQINNNNCNINNNQNYNYENQANNIGEYPSFEELVQLP